MKKNFQYYLIQNFTFLVKIVFCIYFFHTSVYSQVQNNGILFINDNTTLYIGSSNFIFGVASSTKTSRTFNSNGKLQVGADATFIGSSINLFVDGFLSTKSSNYTLLPTGHEAVYAPIGITNSAPVNGVEVAYFNNTISGNIDISLSTLQSAGYWQIKGDNPVITLIWNSDISNLTNSIANLTIAGYNTTTLKWEAISSTIPTGSLISGTISTTSSVPLNMYNAFTFARRSISCANLVNASGNICTWNGTSWDVIPTLADNAVLGASGAPGSFVCNALNIGSNSISLTNGQTIEVVNDIQGNGIISMSSTASILQRNDSSVITPQIVLTKSTRSNMRANDYVYWGSPLNSDCFSQLDGARAYDSSNILQSNSPAFDYKYQYVSGNTSSTGGWQPLSIVEKGKGFIMRIKEQAPFSVTTPYSGHINLTFSGIANNGNVTVNTYNLNATNPASARNYNLLANPYPSAIDADKFLEYNTNLDGVIYLWKATTPNSGLAGVTYANDYIAYTRAGSTAINGVPGDIDFTGKIASGQGFKVKALDNPSTVGQVFFNNCMRIANNNNQFMRTSQETSQSSNRFKVKITDSNGNGNQLVIAYLPEASLAYDRMYDASLNSVSSVQIYTLLDNTSRKLAINARPIFDANDEVFLGYAKSTNELTPLNINITQKEGVFQNSNTHVYLFDSVLNVYHDFNNGAYNFIPQVQEDNSRFKIVYQTPLHSNSFTSSIALALINEGVLKVNSNFQITQVDVYDMTGRKVLTNNPVNPEISLQLPFHYAEGIYIIKMTLSNGYFINQKILNK